MSISTHRLFKSFAAAIALLCCTQAAQAQTPTRFYAPSINNSGAFVWGNDIARHNQTLYPVGSFGAITGPSSIDKIYFQYGQNQPGQAGNILDSVVVRLGQTDSSQLPFGNIIRNKFFKDSQLQLVHSTAQHVIAQGVQGNWFSIQLDSAFTFNPTKALILDIKFKASSTFTFGVGATLVLGRRLRSYANNFQDTIGSSSSGLVPHFGFDFITANNPKLSALGIVITPNPALGAFSVQVPTALAGKEFTLLDATGKVVRKGILAGRMQIQNLNKGLNIFQVEGASERIVVE